VIAVVTGATAGIGWHTARALAHAGAEVLITGRDPARGAQAARQIGAQFREVDHASIADNLALAEWIRGWGRPVDVLVNNVGGAAVAQRTVTAEGNELVLALNYLGPVTLTRALLPALAADVHVVNVVSSAYTMYTGDPFTEPDRYVGINAYARAKQLHLLATMSLARQLGEHARVNAINPGMAWTPGTQALTPAAVPAWRFIWPIVRAVQRRASADKAARSSIDWALRPTGTGQYAESNGKARPLPERLTDPGLQNRAWQWPQSRNGRQA
jgi:NAD(P)-dependent dehydrogenase (short-subunit alcohol dehydrogenase family)